MKIQLEQITPAGRTSLFEHEGSVVRIGRDPSCELLLEGEDAGKAASRQHARIELTPTAARLIDTGSANGTLQNDNPIDGPVTLAVGDRIQLGYTGTTLVVVDLDLTPAPPVAPWRIEPRLLLLVGGGVVAILALLCAVLLWPRQGALVPPATVADGSPTAPATGAPVPAAPPVTTPPPAPPQPRRETKDLVPPGLPSVEVKSVGHYLRAGTARPGILLQRAGDNYPWTVLRSGQAVSTAHSLVSLPGYESLVSLQSGLRLNLWGSLPEFAAPVLESCVMLNNPDRGVAVDLTLDRGRVEIDCGNAGAGARVRLRFLREAWDLVLQERDSKVCVELWQTQVGAIGPEARRCFGLFNRGKVLLRTARQELTLDAPTRVAWSSTQPERVFKTGLPSPPAWWEKPPPASPAVKDAVLSLGDWAKRLDQSPEVIDTIVTFAGNSQDRTDRLLGVWFLAAMEEVSHLVDFLRDKNAADADVRNTAMYALRDWLARNGQRREALTRLIQKRRSYSRRNAARIVSLLSPFSAQACEEPDTYQSLIEALNDDKLEIRHLAAQHLYVELAQRMPQEALTIEYDPTQEASKRQAAIALWRKAVPPGKVPSRVARKADS